MFIEHASKALLAVMLTTSFSMVPTTYAHASEEVRDETASFGAGGRYIEVPEELVEIATVDALKKVENPASSPWEFEKALEESIRHHMGLPAYGQERALPIVIIAARIAGCAAAAYPSISSLSPNASPGHNAMMIANIVVSCIGGGVSAQSIANWILKNPRAFGAILSAIGLGHLAGDSAQHPRR